MPVLDDFYQQKAILCSPIERETAQSGNTSQHRPVNGSKHRDNNTHEPHC